MIMLNGNTCSLYYFDPNSLVWILVVDIWYNNLFKPFLICPCPYPGEGDGVKTEMKDWLHGVCFGLKRLTKSKHYQKEHWMN